MKGEKGKMLRINDTSWRGKMAMKTRLTREERLMFKLETVGSSMEHV